MCKANYVAAIIFALAGASFVSAHAVGLIRTAANFGNVASVEVADRDIDLDKAEFVNVNYGETVRFKSGDSTFAWHFSVFGSGDVIDIARIAPAGMKVKPIKVYISANPMYGG